MNTIESMRVRLQEEQRFRMQQDPDRIRVGNMPGAILRVAVETAGDVYGFAAWFGP